MLPLPVALDGNVHSPRVDLADGVDLGIDFFDPGEVRLEKDPFQHYREV